jgi:hypothetical protein
MWVRRFTGNHKTATVCGCFLLKQCFSLPVSVWFECFLPHAVHGAMLNAARCGCGSACDLNFSPQETAKTAAQKLRPNLNTANQQQAKTANTITTTKLQKTNQHKISITLTTQSPATSPGRG